MAEEYDQGLWRILARFDLKRQRECSHVQGGRLYKASILPRYQPHGLASREDLERMAGHQARGQPYDSRPQGTGKRWKMGRLAQVQKEQNKLYIAHVHLETESVTSSN